MQYRRFNQSVITIITDNPNTTFNANTWYHTVITITNLEVKIYINTVLVKTENPTLATGYIDGTYRLRIMRPVVMTGGSNVSPHFNLNIDDFRIYNKILDIYQIKQLYFSSIPYQQDIIVPINTTQLTKHIWLTPNLDSVYTLPDAEQVPQGTTISLYNRSGYLVNIQTLISGQGFEFGDVITRFGKRLLPGDTATFTQWGNAWNIIDMYDYTDHKSICSIPDAQSIGSSVIKYTAYQIPLTRFAKLYNVNITTGDFTVVLPRILATDTNYNNYLNFSFTLLTGGSGINTSTLTFTLVDGYDDAYMLPSNPVFTGRNLITIIIIGTRYYISAMKF